MGSIANGYGELWSKANQNHKTTTITRSGGYKDEKAKGEPINSPLNDFGPSWTRRLQQGNVGFTPTLWGEDITVFGKILNSAYHVVKSLANLMLFFSWE